MGCHRPLPKPDQRDAREQHDVAVGEADEEVGKPIQKSDTPISRPLRPTVSTSTLPGTFATAEAMYLHVMMRPIWL